MGDCELRSVLECVCGWGNALLAPADLKRHVLSQQRNYARVRGRLVMYW